MRQLSFELDIPETIKKDPDPVRGRKRIRSANRDQIQFTVASLNDLIPEDHRVRDVWEYVSNLDVSSFLDDIKVPEYCGGPATADPRILLTLWVYALLEGIISARQIAKLCKEHHAYIWICGGISINYHTLSDFRTQNPSMFRKLLQESIALMWKSGVFHPDEVAQDGTRVKANAGFSFYRTEKTLKKYLEEANQFIEQLEQELIENPSEVSNRKKSAKKRALNEKKERIERAQNELKQYKEERIISSKKNHNKLTQSDQDKMRASISDPECRKMKMGDGGFRLAYNVQFATSTDKKVIVGVEVVNTQDPGTLVSMIQQVKENLEKIECPKPSKWLADSAYANKDDAELAEKHFSDTTLYSPPKGNGKIDGLTPRKSDNLAMAELRKRMGTEEAKTIYKKRGCTAEFPNATAKNRGMYKFLVQGLDKVTNMALLYALVHNMSMFFRFCD